MIQRNESSKIASIITLFGLVFAISACGGAADSGSSEYDDEFSESTDDEMTDGQTSEEVSPTGFVASGEQDSLTAVTPSNTADPTAFLNKSDNRAMWLWSESPGVEQILNNDGGAQDELFAFLAAPQGQSDRAINRLLFEARGYSNADRFATLRAATFDPINGGEGEEALREFLKRAKSKGIAVEYLDGQAIWVASEANADAPKQICRDIVAFNKGTDDPTERFDGIHLDIEPHTVRNGPYAGVWWENKLPNGYNAEWTQRWKDILNSCRSTLDAYEAETGHKLTLASDLGTDYAFYNKPILDFLNRADGPLDYLTIMNYFDDRANKDGDPAYFYGKAEEGGDPVGGVIENLAEWDNVPLMFAVETGPESIAVDWQSFYQEGYNAMYDTIDTLLEDYNNSKMIGIGIHHYGPNSYKGMQP